MKTRRYQISDVESFPQPLAPGVLYVSIRFSCAAHSCACGCGREVITPLSSIQWRLMRAPAGATLWPSIGNWSFSCRSHYWITCGHVEWAAEISEAAIRESREANARLREIYFNTQNGTQARSGEAAPEPAVWHGWIARLLGWVARQLGR